MESTLLFEIVCIVLIIVCPVAIIMAYKVGITDGQKISRGEPIAPLVEGKAKVIKDKPDPIMDYINVYAQGGGK